MSLAVNLRSSSHLIAVLLQWVGVAFLVPLIVAAIYNEPLLPWIISAAITSALGLILRLLTRDSDEVSMREAFFVVGMSWFSIAVVGSIPYLLIGGLAPIDAFFESMSGFTTTGATILEDIEAHTRGLLFFRSFSQWLGGMGIIVLAIAVLPKLAVGGRQLMEAEIPGGEVDRLTPRIRATARTLYGLYVGLTLAEAMALSLAGLSPFDSILHALSTLPTGGFSPHQESVAVFAPLAQWIIMVFIFLAGINFALLYRSVRKEPKLLVVDKEFRVYLVLVTFAALFLMINIWQQYPSIEESIRHSLFQALTILTGTGFSSTDFNLWSTTTHVLLLVMMFIGGSAGSTTGSIKVLRWMLWIKLLGRELKQILHPRAVIPVRIGKKVIEEEALRGAAVYILLFLSIFVVGTLLLLFDVNMAGGIGGVMLQPLDAMSAIAATLGNVGPGLGIFGPVEHYGLLPAPSKVLLALLMWIGRLEIFPVLVLLTISYWRR
jgi:trk system potassium uptake protein TrkH